MAGKAAIEAAMAELAEVNRVMNPWDADSEIARVLNREASRGPVKVSGPAVRGG